MVLQTTEIDKKVLLAFCFAALVLLFDLSMPLGVAGAIPYTFVIIFVSLALPRKYLIPAVLFLTITGFHFSPDGGELWKVVSNRSLTIVSIIIAAVVGSYVVNVFEKYRSMAAELKILEGYLRICASCKDIKTEDNTWEKLESYISKNSEAQFTHSICPKCSKQMFNEVGL